MPANSPINTIASVGVSTTPIPVTIVSTTSPTTRDNGGTLITGDIWWNSDTSVMSLYVNGVWNAIN